MFTKSALILASLCTVSIAAVRSGKATAEWITSASTCGAGSQVKTGIRLVVDEGYHSYWLNPGDGGMKISVKWELPTGWAAGDIEHPIPKRFMTGELHGFGYEGTVIFPVLLKSPAGFTGEAKLKGTVSWLTCDNKGCIPGEAALELALKSGIPAPTADAKMIDDALAKVPQPQQGWVHLGVTEKPKILALRIEAHLSRPLNLDEYEIFPATPRVIDAATKIQFTRHGADWLAEVPKSEYATTAISELTIVLAPKADQPPLSLMWKSIGK
jgi:DsbC/DsbD-like thiol-disulfide interchange protein